MKVVTLTLSPAFDIHCSLKSFELYHENLADVTAFEAGGKGVNISRALASLGTDSCPIVAIGDENGIDFKRALSADGLMPIYIDVKGRIRQNITLHSADAPETRISFKGFSVDIDFFDRVYLAIENVIDEDTVLTFTGSLPEGASADSAVELLSKIKAMGAKIVVDSRSFSLDNVKAVRPWLIKPNEEEIALYSNRKVTDLESAAIAASEMRSQFSDNVMISLGSLGAVLACEGGAFIAKAPKVNAVSTVGAGDSMIAGFIAAVKRGLDYPEILKLAVSMGSAACMTEGTRPPKKENAEALFREVKVKNA